MINLLVRNDEGLLPPRDLHVLGCLHTEGEVVDLAGCSIQHAYYLNKPELFQIQTLTTCLENRFRPYKNMFSEYNLCKNYLS